MVELVAEQLWSERGAFVGTGIEYSDWGPVVIGTEEETLRRMSLVYPSWTGPAQRCLRRRLTASRRPDLYEMFKSPKLGPWVQEFSFREESIFDVEKMVP